MPDETKDFDTLENYLQNSITQAASMGAFSFAVSSIDELTQMNPQGIETNDNLQAQREAMNEMNKLAKDEE